MVVLPWPDAGAAKNNAGQWAMAGALVAVGVGVTCAIKIRYPLEL